MMSDHLMRGLRVQLTVAMESLLKTAVFEAMKIFENALYGYQKELAQKGNEVAKLKIHLQKTELKLKDLGVQSLREREKNQTQKEQKTVPDTLKHTSEVPEIDFEVPDDWCAPLGCETVTIQEDGVCPSVRLRPFSIPLCQIPVSKHEVVNSDISPERTSGRRISKRISTINKLKHTQDGKLPISGQKSQHPPVTNAVKILFKDLDQEYPDLVSLKLQNGRKRIRNSTENKQDSTEKKEGKEGKNTTTDTNSGEPEEMEDCYNNAYSCKYCNKMFETDYGRRVHELFHNRCRGCRRRFHFQKALRSHKKSCTKFKRLLKKEATKSAKTRRNAHAPRKTQVILKKKDTHTLTTLTTLTTSDNNDEGSPIQFSSTYHGYNFDLPRLRKRMRIYVYEKPYPCSMCPKKFQTSQALGIHKAKAHKNLMETTEPNGDLGWTEPLEDVEEGEKDVKSPIKSENQNSQA